MTYPEALNFMYKNLPMYHRVGAKAYKKDLSRTLQICEHLDNPQNKLTCIHVAGTNGKGSVSHMIAGVLSAHGFQVGLYISPHYKDFRERIKINGEWISKRTVSRFITKNLEAINSIEPSFFEMTVALAFDYFAKQKVDFAVIETGLGGRLDSTNIINPILSVITNIGWDHMDILGDSLEKIAFEKAGIIKPKIPVVIGQHSLNTDKVFITQAKINKSPIYFAQDLISLVANKGRAIIFDDLKFTPDLQGPYQIENYRTALASCKVLIKDSLISLSYKKIKQSFEQVTTLTNMMGRWQWLPGPCDILVDSAHNINGIQYLTQWISTQHYNNIYIVYGCVKDKDINQILEILPKSAYYYFTQAKIPRALPAPDLKNLAAQYNLQGEAMLTVRKAYQKARRKAGAKDIIIVTGSIFVVGEVL